MARLRFADYRWIGFLLTLVFLVLAFRRVDLGEVTSTLQSANYLFVVPAAFLTLSGYVLRTARWSAILSSSCPTRFGPMFSILMIGFATNNVLPARLGEFVRAVLLQRRSGLRKTFSLATIFLERLFDGLVLIAILGGLSLGLPLVGFGHEVQAFSSAVFLSAAAGLLLLVTRESLAQRMLGLALRPLPGKVTTWAMAAFTSFVLGLRAVRRPRVLSGTLVLSLVIWLCEGLSYYVLTFAFDFPLSGLERIVACGLLLVFVNLGIMIPSAPGYVGTFQFFATEALALFGVPRELALSLALVSHVMQYVLVTSIGAFFVVRAQLSWRSLTSASPEESLAAQPSGTVAQ